jgi:adiponectin receptor
MILYLGFVSLLSLAVLIFSCREDFSSPERRGLRGFLFLSLGLSAGLPALHLIFFGSTIEGNIHNPILINWVFGGICYIGGVFIYTSRVPEKIWQGKFCIWGSSHQIWHCMVVGGIVFHFLACLDCYFDRSRNMYC